MLKKITIAVFCVTLSIATACSNSATDSDANKNSGTKEVPEGMKIKKIEPDGSTTPGIPDPKDARIKEIEKGTTPTPGIPDPKTIGKTPVPKGATPTPGIPSPEELKKMKERKVDPGEVNKPTKPRTENSEEVTSPIDRKRRAGKPPKK